jgi:hypothetical protein
LVVSHKVNLMPLGGKCLPQFGGYYTASAKCGVKNNPDFHISNLRQR